MKKRKTESLKVLYYIPSTETVYAARFIYKGYENAFVDLGYEFGTCTTQDNLKEKLNQFNPDLFIYSLNRYTLRFLDLTLLEKYRKKGMVLFCQLQPWKNVNKQFGGGGLSEKEDLVKLIKEGLAGDVFYHWLEQDDPSMEGFEKETGYKFHTILLAADKTLYYPEYDEKYKADISYVGSNLPDKKDFFKKHLYPLRKKYDLKVYGSDWTFQDKLLGYIQKAGQYFNINRLKKIRNIKLPIEDERKVYNSSTVSLNIHENHQRRYGSDFNERTFKIIASGGFEICDNVKVLRRYFTEKELVIAENTRDWFDKINYYLKNPEKRDPIIEAGKEKVLNEHTYHNRVKQISKIYSEFK